MLFSAETSEKVTLSCNFYLSANVTTLMNSSFVPPLFLMDVREITVDGIPYKIRESTVCSDDIIMYVES